MVTIGDALIGGLYLVGCATLILSLPVFCLFCIGWAVGRDK